MSALLRDLQMLSDSGDVEFWYSGAHISEMAPVHYKYTSSAVQRSTCLSALCGRKALVSVDRLIAHEFLCLTQGRHETGAVLSYDGDWFPEIDEFLSKFVWKKVAQTTGDELRNLQVNRAARRQLKAKMFRGGKPSKELGALFKSNKDISAILDMYPMREDSALTLGAYFVGNASKADAKAAFLDSFRDPQWMMLWFSRHDKAMTPVFAWARAASVEMIEKLRQAVESIAVLRARLEQMSMVNKAAGSSRRSPLMDDSWWRTMEDGVVQRILTRSTELSGEGKAISPRDADDLLTGLASCARVYVSLARFSLGDSPRKLKESDWVDCLHAMYAPYVHIFRADTFMAPVIQRHVDKYGVTVVGKLKDLKAVILRRLSA
ncbi:hypothetical protein CAL12_10390 [Bordetella genomosp. 8]|uniref:Uncharacterized protein n=1 Tax=Bordetella genomosp. 8 TaxID=1416806 RepID=A0A1W6YJJ6_9BORD|nr:hypothetical protein CAL12_10390 [Bordetella genomosp. 8]